MTSWDHAKVTWKLAYPVMLSQVGHMMVGVADSMMVGRLGAVPLASVSLANGIFAMIILFGIGVSYGMTPLVASSDGANDKRHVASVFKHGFLLNGLVGLGLVVLAYVGSGLFPYMDQEPEVQEGAAPYFLVIASSMIPLMFFQSFRQFTEGLSLTRQTMIISVVGNIVNVIFNYTLIFGKLGFEPMGLMGAGWATLISRMLMVIALGAYVLFSSRFKKYLQVLRRVNWSLSELRSIWNIGLPSGLQYVFEVGAFSAAAVMIGWFGAVPLASHQIALNLGAITYMAATGISAASTIRMGNQLGKKDYETLRIVGWGCFAMVAVMMSFFAVVFFVFRNVLPSLYIDDLEVELLAGQLLIIAALFQVSDGLQAVGLGVMRGLRDVKLPTIATLVAYWGIAIPLAYVLANQFHLEAIGVWIGLLVGLSLSAIFHMLRFRYLTRHTFPVD